MSRNTNIVDEPITIEEGASHHRDALTYKHPSYGMVHLSRQTCSGVGETLFGAKHPSTTIMSLTIEKAQNTQEISKNWYYGYEDVTEILMTPVQYAELISNPNTSGVPCTIKYTSKDGHIKYKPHATEVEHVEVKIKERLDKLSGEVKGKKAEAVEILSRKGTLKKAEKEELIRLIQNIDQDMQNNIPWYKEQMAKSIDSMVMEANSDIESLVANVQTKLGKKLLDNPEALGILLGNETKLLGETL